MVSSNQASKKSLFEKTGSPKPEHAYAKATTSPIKSQFDTHEVKTTASDKSERIENKV